MDQQPKTEIVYKVLGTERELNIIERGLELVQRLTEIAEEIVDASRTEVGLEGGRSLVSNLNRAFDQSAFHHEASTRHIESATRLNEQYITLLSKQVENQQKIMEQQEKLAKSVEEVKKAQAGQASAIQSLDRRFKNIEGGATQQSQKAPFRDGRTKPHNNRSSKAEGVAQPAVPTSNEEPQPMKKEGTVVITRAPRATNEVNQEANEELQEQVSKLSVVAG